MWHGHCPAATKRRRSIRRGRSNWLQLPLVLQGVCIQGSNDAAPVAAAAGNHHDIAAAAAVAAAFAPSLPQQPHAQSCDTGPEVAVAPTLVGDLQQQSLQQQAVQSEVPDVLAAELPQQQLSSSRQLQQNGASPAGGQLRHIDQVEHPTVVVVQGAQAPVAVAKVAAEVSSAHETSQSSDMTCMQEDSLAAMAVEQQFWRHGHLAQLTVTVGSSNSRNSRSRSSKRFTPCQLLVTGMPLVVWILQSLPAL